MVEIRCVFKIFHPEIQTFFKILRTSEVELSSWYSLNLHLSQAHLAMASNVLDFLLRVHTVLINNFSMYVLCTCYLDDLFLPAYFILAQFLERIAVELKFITFSRLHFKRIMRILCIRYLDNFFLFAYSILALFTAKNCCENETVESKNQYY
ncbi:hypothetical protein MSMAP_0503 [Methanosarcina mazei SarPi]|uniref:Uncharacterized protein n=1 Tax=Methanosarcina mazei SarPi TaxID=1434115 RepID=A0A0E3R9L7_METMZ|nr:hypothetical protein MSMAP_0503 [Methanosarcina mazei SarPi]